MGCVANEGCQARFSTLLRPRRGPQVVRTNTLRHHVDATCVVRPEMGTSEDILERERWLHMPTRPDLTPLTTTRWNGPLSCWRDGTESRLRKPDGGWTALPRALNVSNNIDSRAHPRRRDPRQLTGKLGLLPSPLDDRIVAPEGWSHRTVACDRSWWVPPPKDRPGRIKALPGCCTTAAGPQPRSHGPSAGGPLGVGGRRGPGGALPSPRRPWTKSWSTGSGA